MKRFLLALALFPLIVAGGGVDVDGAPLAPSSRLGDVDGENSTIADVFNAANTNAYTKAETDARIVELAPTPGDYLNVSNRAMSAVQTESDPTVPAWAKASTPPPSMTTNAVREIVTGEVPILSDWTFSGDTAYFHHLNMRHTPASDAGGGTHEKWSLYESQFLLAEMEAGEFATNLYFSAAGITATRTALGSTNALGLARLVDLPPLTNGIPEAMSEKASTNDVQLSPVYSQTPTFSDWTILRNDEDVTAQVQQPVYEESDGYWQVFYVDEDEPGPDQFEEPIDINRLTWHDSDDAHNYIATRTCTDIIGYTLGAQTNDFLASLSITNWMASVELLNFVSNALVKSSTNYTDSAISNADTTYTRFAISAPTNVNQSVQYINIVDEFPSILSVKIPEGTGTKDWMIYVQSVTNVSIKLDVATWWMADVAYTNDIPPETPTALYFSQIDTGLYLFSRQELAPVTIPAP